MAVWLLQSGRKVPEPWAPEWVTSHPFLLRCPSAPESL